MTKSGNQKGFERKVILVVCEDSHLAALLVNKLAGQGFVIALITNRKKDISRSPEREEIIFIKNIKKFQKSFNRLDYLIYCEASRKQVWKTGKLNTQEFESLLLKYNARSIFATYGVRRETHFNSIENKINNLLKVKSALCKLVVYGDLVSMTNRSIRTYLNWVVEKLSRENVIEINPLQKFYPVSYKDFSVYLIKLLFSLDGYGASHTVVGTPVSAARVICILGLKKEVIKLNPFQPVYLPVKTDHVATIKRFSNRNIKDLYAKFEKLNSLTKRVRFLSKEKLQRFFPSKKRLLLAGILSALIFPVLLLLMSLCFLIYSRKFLDMGYLSISKSTTEASLIFAKGSNSFATFGTKIPLINYFYKSFLKPSSLVVRESETAKTGIAIVEKMAWLMQGLIEKEDIDMEDFSYQLNLDLEDFYQRLGFLEAELKGDGIYSEILSWPLDNLNFNEVRERTLLLMNLSKKLPLIMGEDSTLKYGVFFQNTRVLRPTGGEIEAFLIVTLNSGKISDLSVEDVFLADSKLLGIVEPPEVLNKYFGRTSWYLKDANWDPELFLTSVSIESFLDMELDISLDGVILVDDEFLTEVFLQLEAGEEENVRNLFGFDETGEYPAERKSRLVGFLKSLGGWKVRMSERDRVEVLKALYEGLENDNIQMRFRDEEIQKVFEGSNWEGSFYKKSCVGECYSDFLSYIEATHLGDAKAIKREAQLFLSFEEKVVKRKLALYLENDSEEIYSTYIRVFVNKESGFVPLLVSKLDENKSISLEVRAAGNLKEAGTYLELAPEESVALVFMWETEFTGKFDDKGEYNLLWKKQPGADPFSVEIFVNTPLGVNVFTEPEHSLTEEGNFRYNTTLVQDKVVRVFW